jgi:hypothetical protein
MFTKSRPTGSIAQRIQLRTGVVSISTITTYTSGTATGTGTGTITITTSITDKGHCG